MLRSLRSSRVPCLLWLVVVSSWFCVATAQTWQGCVNPTNPNVPENIKIGDPHTICITMGPSGNWVERTIRYARYTFQPNADEYSKFHIPNSYADLVNSAQSPLRGNITVHVAAQNSLSFLRLYHDSTNFRIYPHLTAIVDVDNGKVTGIAWDDACVFCSKNKCDENMYNFEGTSAADLNVNAPSKGCWFTQEHCNEIISKGGTECDITIYVVWTGSDKNGNSLQSASKRFSAFPAQSIQNRLSNQLPSFTGLGSPLR